MGLMTTTVEHIFNSLNRQARDINAIERVIGRQRAWNNAMLFSFFTFACFEVYNIKVLEKELLDLKIKKKINFEVEEEYD